MTGIRHNKILLGHGSGGRMTHHLIRDIFRKYLNSDELSKAADSAILDLNSSTLAFTTDSFVVDPVFFPGGDIGKLAVAGTVNDLAVAGADPRFLSAAFILEEGFSLEDLEKIVASMAAEAAKAGVQVVAGDTKVVNRGKCDKIFINTSGIGETGAHSMHISTGKYISPGDNILINGPVADHGMAIMASREGLGFSTGIRSDCGCLNKMIRKALDTGANIRFMRDATRGGLATVMCEVVSGRSFGIRLDEEYIPVNENTRGLCELLGFDPLYVANEGKVVMIVSHRDTDKVLDAMRSEAEGRESRVIGEVVRTHPGMCVLKTSIGGSRILDMLSGEQLPRIC